MPKTIAIIGGGLTGLMAAHDLERSTDAEILLFERGSRLGGKVRTERCSSFVVEDGPDCFFARKPGVMDIVCELDLEAELIAPNESEFSIFSGDRLNPVARGLISFTDLDFNAVDNTGSLSPEGKARAKAEESQPVSGVQDESIRSFFSRRFGPEFSRVIAEPLLAGTHGGDPNLLSMKALFPHFLQLEKSHGSISRSTPVAAGKPAFLSFRGGMQTLVDALAKSLQRTHVHLDCKISALHDVEADRFLLAAPANHAAKMIEGEPSKLMAEIEHRSSAIVTFEFPSESLNVAGTGFLVPFDEGLSISGATFSSGKWASRAPLGHKLIRVFLGGDRQILAAQTDDELSATALADLEKVIPLGSEPLNCRVVRWIDALPQYNLGHAERVAAIRESLPPDVFIAGTSFDGVGVPDCLRQGREAARSIQQSL